MRLTTLTGRQFESPKVPICYCNAIQNRHTSVLTSPILCAFVYLNQA